MLEITYLLECPPQRHHRHLDLPFAYNGNRWSPLESRWGTYCEHKREHQEFWCPCRRAPRLKNGYDWRHSSRLHRLVHALLRHFSRTETSYPRDEAEKAGLRWVHVRWHRQTRTFLREFVSLATVSTKKSLSLLSWMTPSQSFPRQMISRGRSSAFPVLGSTWTNQLQQSRSWLKEDSLA